MLCFCVYCQEDAWPRTPSLPKSNASMESTNFISTDNQMTKGADKYSMIYYRYNVPE